MPEDWVQIYFNQKDINYISPSNIRASVETRSPQLHNFLSNSLPPPSLTFYEPPRWASLVCVINIFLVHKVILYKGRNCIDYQLYSD